MDNDNGDMDTMENTVSGAVGVFPAVLEPAKLVAAMLAEGQLAEIPSLPGFWVGDEENEMKGLKKISSFTLAGRTFFVLESNS